MSELRDITDKGGLCYSVDVITDAKNLLLALEVARTKAPAEILVSSVVDAVEARDRGHSSTGVARHAGHDRGWPHEGFDVAQSHSNNNNRPM